ncbi:MAG: DUF1203 domain-containing protein [Rhizomicrobium sp.]
MPFRIRGLAPEPFRALFALGDTELAARDIRRVVADAPRSAPCRVTLEDAVPGEELLLLPFAHHTAASPYRASGPIYVRKAAEAAFDRAGELPPVFRGRLLAVRAYDAHGTMRDADVADSDPIALFEKFFADSEVQYLHVHYARRGCYSCLVERA